MSKQEIIVKELTPEERMVIEVEKAAYALGITVPSSEYVTETLRVLGKLKKIPPEKRNTRVLEDVGISTFYKLMLTAGQDSSAMIIWNTTAQSWSGGKLVPHNVSLIKTDVNSGREWGANWWMPVKEYPIAQVPVGTTDLNFDHGHTPGETHIGINGKLIVSKTLIKNQNKYA